MSDERLIGIETLVGAAAAALALIALAMRFLA
jgi:hypothetical protein